MFYIQVAQRPDKTTRNPLSDRNGQLRKGWMDGWMHLNIKLAFNFCDM